MEIEFILYVKDQERSRKFYEDVLNATPTLHVQGMTEFLLAGNVKIGLMPETGINKILAGKTPHPTSGNGIPRCELYLKVKDITVYKERAGKAGALIICEPTNMDWGDRVTYLMDPDGHILAFAQPVNP